MRTLLPLLALLTACKGGVTVDTCSVATSDQMSILPELSLSLSEPAESFVRYSLDGEDPVESAPQTTNPAVHSLRGLMEDVDVAWEAFFDQGDGPESACSGTFHTDSLPGDVDAPIIDVAAAADLGGPELFLGVIFELFGDHPNLVVFDRQGRIRWVVPSPASTLAVDSQIGLDGNTILYNFFDASFKEDIGEIRTVDFDGNTLADLPTTQGHHMFAQLPDGTIAYQALDVRDWTDPEDNKEYSIAGDAIVEIAPDGTNTTISSVWDWAEPQPSASGGLFGIYGRSVDWTHGNALKHDATKDEYLLSLGNSDLIAWVDRASGQPVEIFGGDDLPVRDGDIGLMHQHDPTFVDEDHMTVFTTSYGTATSGAAEYLIDREAGELVQIWSQGWDEGVFSPMFGQVERLESGHTIVNYGGGGRIEEVDENGTLVWALDLPEGFAFAQVRPFEGFWP